jgi:hypothetical protein
MMPGGFGMLPGAMPPMALPGSMAAAQMGLQTAGSGAMLPPPGVTLSRLALHM